MIVTPDQMRIMNEAARQREEARWLARLRTAFPGSTARHPDETLRRFVMQAIAREETENGEVIRREANEVARWFGEVIVFDHCLVDIFAEQRPFPRRPNRFPSGGPRRSAGKAPGSRHGRCSSARS